MGASSSVSYTNVSSSVSSMNQTKTALRLLMMMETWWQQDEIWRQDFAKASVARFVVVCFVTAVHAIIQYVRRMDVQLHYQYSTY